MHGRLFQFDLGFLKDDLVMPGPSYFVLLLAGFMIATIMGAIWARRVGQNPDVIVDLGLAMVLAGIAGSRLLHVLADGHFMEYVHRCTDPSLVSWHVSRRECLGPDIAGKWDAVKFVCHPAEPDCFAWAKFYNGGFTYYGGFVAASVTAWYLLKTDRFPFWKAADMAGMVVPVGLGFGRLGCLLAGCCFGKPWHSHLALKFPGGSPASEAQHLAGLVSSNASESLAVHPTQLYESAASFAIAAFLILYLHGRKRYDGQVFVAFVGAYAVVRFLLEFARADDRGGILFLSTSQLLGILLVGAAVLAHRRLSARAQSEFGAAAPPSLPPTEATA
jgi:phosphatidylglycerol:prolipoprotein diacylglycerol transferase